MFQQIQQTFKILNSVSRCSIWFLKNVCVDLIQRCDLTDCRVEANFNSVHLQHVAVAPPPLDLIHARFHSALDFHWRND